MTRDLRHIIYQYMNRKWVVLPQPKFPMIVKCLNNHRCAIYVHNTIIRIYCPQGALTPKYLLDMCNNNTFEKFNDIAIECNFLPCENHEN